MNENLSNLKKAYDLYKEFEEFMNSLGKGYEIPNNLTVKLDCEKECIYVSENNEEDEFDLDEFRSKILDYIEGGEEAIHHRELNQDYHKVLDGKMTEQEFIELSGKLQLGIFKLNNIINEMNSI